jgi:hypothetical protein
MSDQTHQSEFVTRCFGVLAAKGLIYDTGDRRPSKRPPHDLTIVWERVPGVTEEDLTKAIDEMKQDVAAGRL